MNDFFQDIYSFECRSLLASDSDWGVASNIVNRLQASSYTRNWPSVMPATLTYRS